MGWERLGYVKDLKLLASEIERLRKFWSDTKEQKLSQPIDESLPILERIRLGEENRFVAHVADARANVCITIIEEMKEIFSDDKEEIWGSEPTCENTGTTSGECATA